MLGREHAPAVEDLDRAVDGGVVFIAGELVESLGSGSADLIYKGVGKADNQRGD